MRDKSQGREKDDTRGQKIVERGSSKKRRGKIGKKGKKGKKKECDVGRALQTHGRKRRGADNNNTTQGRDKKGKKKPRRGEGERGTYRLFGNLDKFKIVATKQLKRPSHRATDQKFSCRRLLALGL